MACRALEAWLAWPSTESCLTRAEFTEFSFLINEVVNNAFEHSGTPADAQITLHLAIAPGGRRAEICDAGAGFDRLEGPSTGLGLQLLDAMSTRWGRSTESGHCVWFEVGSGLTPQHLTAPRPQSRSAPVSHPNI
jgi:anti-sigma regulatory factor (Ser/Thr protein kinase)